MRLWTIGILLFVSSISCASLNDQIQSRYVDGDKSQTIEIRRKSSTREADYYEKIDIPLSKIDIDSTSDQKISNVNINVDGDADSEVVIKYSDLAGESGVLIVPSSSPSNVPLVFAVRPIVSTTNNNKHYLKMQIFDDSEISEDEDVDDDDRQDCEDLSDEVVDSDFDDYSDDNKQKWQIQTNKKLNRKQSSNSPIVPNSIKYKAIPKTPSNRKIRIFVWRKPLSHQDKNKKSNIKGSTVSPTANYTITEKESELEQLFTKEKSQGGSSSIDSEGRLPNKKYGQRKRYKGKRNNFNYNQFKLLSVLK
ncbi:MATH and LRR domain-containing protein PFE0570w-like [Eupeodes corollae]|uniref:MATH and LRR domain-containing protein PFE0570w-like n=1 Tax=Eupeodes corollae TaxID=290404 RepID=UPI002490D41C|nr:MATH and LRR domain-containing protein PFE0570w-like [Eupeodes corollae]